MASRVTVSHASSHFSPRVRVWDWLGLGFVLGLRSVFVLRGMTGDEVIGGITSHLFILLIIKYAIKTFLFTKYVIIL